ncbi:glycosyltransferase family 25 protein [Endozoicomonas sp. Mp262]|uniref:glycosyltransferase family 25 protein n=1 Tax=Endozoicomonas sp. Mp262 TaxID=2919499 RepID=UPI0021D7F81E
MKQSISIPTYVICLEREADRRRHIARHLESFNIDFQFSNAVDGRQLTEKEKNDKYSEKKAIDIRGRALAPGELGCYLSHCNIWHQMVEHNIQHALILESDAEFSEEAIAVINALNKFPADWELIMLYYRDCYPSFWNQAPITNNTKLVRFSNKSSCTTAYLLSLSGARKLLKHAYPLCLPVDDYMTGGYINKGVNLYAAYPRTIELTEGSDETSVIRPDINAMVGHDTLKARKQKKQGALKQLEKRSRRFIKQIMPAPWL